MNSNFATNSLGTGTFSVVAIGSPVDTSSSRKVRNNVCIHSIFIDLASFTNDVYWINFLTKLSRGKFPRNFSLINSGDEQSLCFRKMTKIFRLSIAPASPDKLLDLINFLQDHGVVSQSKIQPICQNEAVTATWSDLKDSEKEIRMKIYARKLSEEWKLTENERLMLSTKLLLATGQKMIKPTDIVFDGRQIVAITGIDWNATSRSFAFQHTEKARTQQQFTTINMINKSGDREKVKFNSLVELEEELIKIDSYRAENKDPTIAGDVQDAFKTL